MRLGVGLMALAVAGCAAPPCDEGDHACWLTRLIVTENGQRVALVDVEESVLREATLATTPGEVWAVGIGSVMLRFDGTQLRLHEGGSGSPLNAVSQTWAVGQYGELMQFDGTTWKTTPRVTGYHLRDVSYPVAVGGGGTLLKANGTTWTSSTVGTHSFWGVWASSTTVGWAVGASGVIYSLRSSTTEASGVTTTLFDVWSPTAAGTTAWAVGEGGVILRGVLNGNTTTWTRQTSPVTSDLRRVFGSSATDLWIVGEQGVILRSTDGTTWTQVASGVNTWLTGGAALGPTDAWAVGDHGVVLRWDGAAWRPVTSPTLGHLTGVHANGAGDVWFSGWAGVALRRGGSDWTTFSAGALPPLYGVWGSSGKDVWLLGDGSTIWHWDGQRLESVALPQFMWGSALSGSARDDVWAVGLGGRTAHWNGSEWSAHSSGITSDLFGVFVSGPNDAVAVGLGGSALRWNGAAWTAPSSGTSDDFYAVSGSGPADVWAVGPGGLIRHFDGSTWSASASGTTNELYSVSAIAPGAAWAVGQSGTALRLSDGAWSSVPSASQSHLVGVWAGSSDEAWAVGTLGSIVRWSGSVWSETWKQTTPYLITTWGTGRLSGGLPVPSVDGAVSPMVHETFERPRPLPLPWKDPNKCRPSFCFSVCPRGVRCVTQARCTPSIRDGLLASRTTLEVAWSTVPTNLTTDFDLVVRPVSAPDCPTTPGKSTTPPQVGGPLVVRQTLGKVSTGGTGGGGVTPSGESWDGTFSGSSDTSTFFCSNGVVSHTGSFSITVPRSLTAALKVPYDSSARITSGSGRWTSEATPNPNCQGGPYTIVTERPTDVAIQVTNASPVVEITGQPPIPEIQLRSDLVIVPFHLRQTSTNEEVDLGARDVVLEAETVEAGQITGRWKIVGDNSASGNWSKGTFTLKKR